ncbi:MAG: A24 family peptidase [Planctomycetaceae bacterium]
MNDLVAFPGVVIVVASIVAGITDVWKFKVYNLLTVPLLAGAFLFHGIGSGWEGLLGSFVGFALALTIFILPYGFGAIGAGDVKYMTAVGAWLGPTAMVHVTLVGCLATGLYTLAVIVYYRRVRETWINLQIIWHRLRAVGQYVVAGDGQSSVQELVGQPDRRGRLVPISAMMSVGVLTYLLWHH